MEPPANPDRNTRPDQTDTATPSRTMMLAIPCMSMVPTEFAQSLVNLRPVCPTYSVFTKNTLIHDARNELLVHAIDKGCDRILYIDSDMRFNPDLIRRMDQTMDEVGCDFLCGIYFTRAFPIKPTIYSAIREVSGPNGTTIAVDTYYDYPRDAVFEIAGAGFGAVMLNVAAIKAIWDTQGPPFDYIPGIGEDLSFCYRLQKAEVKMYCDSRIKLGHVGTCEYNENLYNPDAVRSPDRPVHEELVGSESGRQQP